MVKKTNILLICLFNSPTETLLGTILSAAVRLQGQISFPRECPTRQIPYSPGTSDGQMPGVCPGRGDFEVLNQWAHKRQGQQY